MTRVQIQLPDEVYQRARSHCEDREISFAEFARRGIEYMLGVYAPGAGKEWELPKPRKLGWRGLTDSQLKEEAQRTLAEDGYVIDRHEHPIPRIE